MAVPSKKLFPVIRCVDPQKRDGVNHAIENTRIAMKNGADGVFLAGHDVGYLDLSHIFENVRGSFPETWIGINFLDTSLEKDWDHLSFVARRREGLNALWIDGLPDERLLLPNTTSVYGGIASKYINPNLSGETLRFEYKKAIRTVDVATIGGKMTGQAPDIETLKAIRANLGPDFPLALVGGVNVGNVVSFLPYVNEFLVLSLTEIDQDYGGREFLIPEKVRELTDLVHV